jgi:hypothetical protein
MNWRLPLEIVALFVVAAMIWLAVIAWPTLPDRIPTHYGVSGEPNSWGSKSTIWILIGIGSVLYGLLSLLPRFDGLWNLPVAITPENRARLMPLVQEMSTVLKLVVLPIFLWIVWCQTQQRNLGPWFLPYTLVSSIGTAIFYQVRMRRVAAQGTVSLPSSRPEV